MTDVERWQRENAEYLAAAVAWVRGRLVDRAEGASSGRSRAHHPAAPSRDELGAALRLLEEAEQRATPPALVHLGRRLGLGRFERDVLLLCTALELDTRVAGLCADAQADPGRPHPTFALALALFDDPSWDALSPEHPLRYWRLLDIYQPAAQPLTSSALRADERIVSFLKGLNYLDDRLAPLLAPVDVEAGAGVALPASQQRVVDAILHALGGSAEEPFPPVLELLGSDSESKKLIAQRAGAAFGLRVYRLPAALLPEASGELETLVRLWHRESLLLPIVLYVDAGDSQEIGPGRAQVLRRFLSRSRTPVFLDSREVRLDVDRSIVALEVTKPTPGEQREAWRSALGVRGGDAPERMASQFQLDLASIHRLARAVLREHGERDEVPADVLWDACLSHTRPRLDLLAQRIESAAGWDDIVVPELQAKLLREIADQISFRSRVYDDWGFRARMNRGLGLSALFVGESGTGKTLAAEILANHLRLNLYRIDLSAVVSKYIGETEKNLRRLFDAAEDGGAILFFDEADALFGKRSEVKDSHDRYANIEINYLLQRMEAYHGLAILATNMKSALDQAFVRRLRFIIEFPFPSVADRRTIWERAFPAAMPTEGLEYDWLARLNLTGASIQNVALNAAFLAARADTPVTMPLVLQATRTELRKVERPVNEAELRWPRPERVA